MSEGPAAEPPTPDPGGLAMELAMEEARGNPALQDRVAAFLDDQRRLIADQRHHLQKQLPQIGLRSWELRLGVLLRVATAFIGLAVAAGFAWLIWNAAQSNQMVIGVFQVPPELAARGLTGPVVAARLSDRIGAMQAQTNSARAPRSYASGISEGLKLEIPETGVSLSELDRFLREKLGRDLHIGGEVVQTGNGIALTVRAGANGSATVQGSEAEIDSLMQRLAEQAYRLTQPYRFGVWLQAQGRPAEGIEVLRHLAESNAPPSERAWAFNGWGVATRQWTGRRASLPLLLRGQALDPDNFLVITNLAAGNVFQGRIEDGIRHYQMAAAALKVHGSDYTQQERVAPVMHTYNAFVLAQRGDLLAAAREQRLFIASGVTNVGSTTLLLAEILTALHEPAAAGVALAEAPPSGTVANRGIYHSTALRARLLMAVEKRDVTAVPAIERDYAALVAEYPGFAEDRPTSLDPYVALTLAYAGQFATAEARLTSAPGDCYPCLRARAQVAALQGQEARADFWFARAVAEGPSIPHADAEWGRALLDRGQPDAAIVKFQAANRKGPKFADPLAYWGEALMAKNQSHLALAKFQQASLYAPNWGRLHLKWGQALAYAGKPDEAKAKFARAATLDLTPSEKAELARQRP